MLGPCDIIIMTIQCSKLSIYFVHTSGAEGPRIVHPTIFLYAQAYIVQSTLA